MASAAFEDIVADFEFLEDWEERYRYVIEQGKSLPAFDDALKCPRPRLRAVPRKCGCFQKSTRAGFRSKAIAMR